MNEYVLKKYIDGRGLSANTIFEGLKSGINPVVSENKLVIALNAITKKLFPSNNSFAVMAKSPLTGIWGEAMVKGFLGPELRHRIRCDYL